MITRFPTLRLEGGLISSDQIDRVADQKGKELSIDDIAAAWSDIRSYWTLFEKSLVKLPEDNLATSETRNRWMIPFFTTLGYELSSRSAAEVDGQTYAISHRAGKEEDSPPIHIVGIRQSLDRRPESGRPRLAPHSLVQEYLNRTEHLWGIVTNGSALRILRDSHLLRKQAYIEFDLEQMMKDEQFADFALLFRLIHASRLPKGIDDADSCLLEQFHRQTIEQGGRVRNHLRKGVERALTQFANGFLSHPRNTALRVKVQDKSLEPFEYYQQLLRLIYRFLFLAVSEERNLITDNMPYRQYYSISRIRRLTEVRAAYTSQEDLWLGLATSFKLFQDESLGPLLSVPTLNGDLFDPIRTSEINGASLSNRDLLTAMWDICMYREQESAPWRRINYAALNVEELGSVYESLLDFQPVFIEPNGKPTFALFAGTERKSTGSYYTPPELVNELIQSSLVPVIKGRLALAKTTPEKEAALLTISVCDPACGSGHFLLAAARTIGRELAKVSTGDEEPAPEQMRIAIRDVITHCIYGVDKNPLAVDLCKVALWLEGHTKSKPLTFLDHRVRCGDSLVGVFDLAVLNEGIPDDAFTAVAGDDKAIARELKKQNKNERLHRSLTEFDASIHTITESRKPLLEIPDNTPEQIRQKATLFRLTQQEGTPWCKDKTACDLWTAAFFVVLSKEQVQDQLVPTTDTVRQYVSEGAGAALPQLKIARQLSNQYRFFHWALEFPEVFARGGFDCVLGNPPWDMIKENSDEFFSFYDPNFRRQNSKAKKQQMKELCKNQEIAIKWLNYEKLFNSLTKYFKESASYKSQGTGHLNAFKLFTERYYQLIANTRYFGIVIPSSIHNDEGCTDLRKLLLDKSKINALFSFENRNKIFPIDSRFKFVLLSTQKGGRTEILTSGFMLHEIKNLAKLKEEGLKIPVELIKRFSPDTLSVMEFTSQYEISLMQKIFSDIPLLGEKIANTWNVVFHRELNLTDDDNILQTTPTSVPVYEGKMIHHFTHSYEDPQYWLTEKDAKEFYSLSCYPAWKFFRLAYRAVASSTNETTMICSILPKNTGSVNSVRVIELFAEGADKKKPVQMINDSEQLFLTAVMNSFVINYITRRKVSANLSAFFIYQLPIPRLKSGSWYFEQLVPRAARLICTDGIFSEFWSEIFNSSWGKLSAVQGGSSLLNDWNALEKEWTDLCGVYGWDSTKHDKNDRAQLRCEIDALVSHLYGLDKKELEYILSTFPAVKENSPWLIENTLREFERFIPIKP
jgi:hypothetical protein